MPSLIYLTGAPATGKSSLTRELGKRVRDLSVFCYSAELRDYVNRLEGATLDELNIRQQSARVITQAHVEAVDELLMARVEQERSTRHFIIDSHAVTKEDYGFRVTGFSEESVKRLKPDCVICLYAGSEIISQRIAADAQGRPLPTRYEIELHNQTQISMATFYSVIAGCPCYLIDTSISPDALAQRIISIAKLG